MDQQKLFERTKQVAIAVIAVASVALMIWGVWNAGSGHAAAVESVWIYNLETEEFSSMPAETAIPPVALDDGVGYKALPFTCGSCGEGEFQVVYLAKYSDDAGGGESAGGRQELIASVEMARKGEWVPGGLYAKSQFMEKAVQNCADSFKLCLP